MLGRFLSCLRAGTSAAILAAIAAMFIVLSCHGGSLQLTSYPAFHAPTQTCEEHTLEDAGTFSTQKSIFNSVDPTSNKLLGVALLIAVLVVIFPKQDVVFSHRVKLTLAHNQRQRWIWARNLPFSSVCFLPSFAARCDQ